MSLAKEAALKTAGYRWGVTTYTKPADVVESSHAKAMDVLEHGHTGIRRLLPEGDPWKRLDRNDRKMGKQPLFSTSDHAHLMTGYTDQGWHHRIKPIQGEAHSHHLDKSNPQHMKKIVEYRDNFAHGVRNFAESAHLPEDRQSLRHHKQSLSLLDKAIADSKVKSIEFHGGF